MEFESVDILLLVLMAGAAFLALLLRYRTPLLGFSLMAAFAVGSASLSAYVLTVALGLDAGWITPDHEIVFLYSAVGLIAMALGIGVAWRPLRPDTGNGERPVRHGAAAVSPTARWLNPHFIFFCVTVGAAISLVVSYAYQVPTLRAVVSGYLEWPKMGVLAAVCYAITRRDWRPLLLALAIFLPVTLISVFRHGFAGGVFTFVLHLLVVGLFLNGARLRSVVLLLVLAVPLSGPLVGWLESRSIIRDGRDTGLTATQAAQLFAPEFLRRSNPLDITSDRVRLAVMDRVDMSAILAAQVSHQPEIEPFANGRTVLDDIVVALVPRFLWPDKPVRAGGNEFVSRFTGLSFASATSVALPFQFELYANGGEASVVLGLFLLGWIVGRLELELFRARTGVSLRRLLPAMAVLLAVSAGSQRLSLLAMTVATAAIGAYAVAIAVEHLSPQLAQSLLGTDNDALSRTAAASGGDTPVPGRQPPSPVVRST